VQRHHASPVYWYFVFIFLLSLFSLSWFNPFYCRCLFFCYLFVCLRACLLLLLFDAWCWLMGPIVAVKPVVERQREQLE
jgi:hypothetical protein